MEIILQSPESVIISQYAEIDDPKDGLYLISKGSCKVVIQDKFNEKVEDYKTRTLKPGDHFGEIALMYQGTVRSATVSVEKDSFLTAARISKNYFTEILQFNPSLNEELRNYILMYDDPLCLFLNMSLDQVDWFKDLPTNVKSEIIFNMEHRQLDKDDLVTFMG